MVSAPTGASVCPMKIPRFAVVTTTWRSFGFVVRFVVFFSAFFIVFSSIWKLVHGLWLELLDLAGPGVELVLSGEFLRLLAVRERPALGAASFVAHFAVVVADPVAHR